MVNQDEVALRLTRTPAAEMHELVLHFPIGRATVSVNTWTKFVQHPAVEQFLLANGWTLDEYIIECNKAYVMGEYLSKYHYMLYEFSAMHYGRKTFV